MSYAEAIKFWTDYVTNPLRAWIYHHCRRHLGLSEYQFDSYLFDVSEHLAEEWNKSLRINAETLGLKHPIVRYRSRNGEFECEFRWWIIRKIFSLHRKGRSSPTEDAVEKIEEFSAPEKKLDGNTADENPCRRIESVITAIDGCLQMLSEREKVIIFFGLRNSEKPRSAAGDIEKGKKRKDPVEATAFLTSVYLPDECAEPVLSRYGLTDRSLSESMKTLFATPDARNMARFRARKKLTDCLIIRYGSAWKHSLLSRSAEQHGSVNP